MSKAYDPGAQMAYPCEGPNERAYGLTKRELLAAMAMQGLIARGVGYSNSNGDAQIAVRYADALLVALGQTS